AVTRLEVCDLCGRRVAGLAPPVVKSRLSNVRVNRVGGIGAATTERALCSGASHVNDLPTRRSELAREPHGLLHGAPPGREGFTRLNVAHRWRRRFAFHL